MHALKIKEVDTLIESEIAGVRTSIQSAKFNVLQVGRVARETHTVPGRCCYWCRRSSSCLPAHVPLGHSIVQSWFLCRLGLVHPMG